MTGHLLGAAGAVEAIASILAIKNGIIPPTINHEEGDNDENIDYDLNFTFNKAQKREVNVALSNTFGSYSIRTESLIFVFIRYSDSFPVTSGSMSRHCFTNPLPSVPKKDVR